MKAQRVQVPYTQGNRGSVSSCVVLQSFLKCLSFQTLGVLCPPHLWGHCGPSLFPYMVSKESESPATSGPWEVGRNKEAGSLGVGVFSTVSAREWITETEVPAVISYPLFYLTWLKRVSFEGATYAWAIWREKMNSLYSIPVSCSSLLSLV